jgi:ketosteroid isomerase-like protein
MTSMRLPFALAAACVGLCAGCAPPVTRSDTSLLERQVADTERAFARTMAERDHAAFASFVSEEAVFVTDPQPLRGKAQVAAAWKGFYDKPEAPFSWAPEKVVVLDSGTLALSTGPVRDSRGRQVAAYTSIWRLEAPGVWRIVFDKGDDVCDCPK